MGDLQLCADTVFLAQGTSVCGEGGGEGTMYNGCLGVS